MSRVLFLGDLSGTGFGTVTQDLGRVLIDRGEDVRFLSLNEEPGELPEPFASRTALLGLRDGWLAQNAAQMVPRMEGMFTGALFDDGWTPETGVILGDVGSLKISPVLRFIPDGMKVFHYVPIEGIGLPPAWAALWAKASPVAVAEFGADEIAKVTGVRPPVVYHGVNTDAFYPVSPDRPIVMKVGRELAVMRTKADCKRFAYGSAEGFVLFRADRHMPRKQYPALFRALAPVLARHPDVRLVWHCLTMDQGGDLSDERSKFAPPIAARMQSTGLHDRYGGVDRKLLNVLYNAADVYVSTSAEGFGLTIAEAMACGVPAVGLDFSAVPEIIGKGGILVPVGGLVENIYSHFWARPNEDAFGAAVESLITSAGRRRDLGHFAAAHIRQSFSWARAAEQFSGLIEGAVRQEAAA